MDSFRIHLLGSPRIEKNGRSVTVQRRKTMALLAYLVMTDQRHSRDALAVLFWPEMDQAAARANLRRDLSRLRELLGEHFLEVSRSEVCLNPAAAIWLDTAVFIAYLAAVRQHDHPPSQLCPTCQTILTDALALYGGDFLTGFSLPDSPEFDRWQFFQVESLRHHLAELLQTFIQWHVSQGKFEPGIAYARRWLALDPLHEPAHRQLMQLYAWSGQHAAALRQYQECVTLLEDELGVPPEAETTQLYEAIRTRQLTAPHEPEPAAAAPLAERFTPGPLLAVGGHGELYQGEDRLTGQPVVIKRVRPELLTHNPEYMTRFQREGQLLSELNHPNIVKMLALFERGGHQHIVMEFVPGGSLRQLLEQRPQLPLEQALTIALELADALSRAHHLNIIHRDIKPENVLLAADGSPRLTDFGLARLRRDDSQITQAGLFIGSPAYMSPEALRGEEVDAHSDIWSFGVLLYEMLAGRRPFTGEQIAPLMVRILNDPLPEIGQFRSHIPAALVYLLRRMLMKNRQERIRSMRLVAAALESVREGYPLAPEIRIDRLLPSPAHVPTLREEPIFTPDVIRTPPPLPSGGGFYNLPPQPTVFVGREKELSDLRQWLGEKTTHRLITIAGPGGMGKTRLALAAAQAVLDAFPDGVFFVPLASLTTAEHILSALLESLHVQPLSSKEPKEQVLTYLSQKQILLVMDNFEHLLDGADLVAEIGQAAPLVKILVTSRERLRLSLESVYALGGLAYPQEPPPPEGWSEEQIAAFDALKLLQQRAQAMQVTLPLPFAEQAAMVRICHLVEGMPLALMLATSWLPLLSFKEIATEIARHLDFLEVEMRDLPERQRSMRATIDSSWKHLAAEEQQVFMKLAVFRGGFTRQAAQEVAGANLRTLRTLADKSLLALSRRGRDGLSERYEIHELLRQYGAEALEKAGLADETRQQHSRYYLHWLQEHEPDIKGRNQIVALREIEADMENIRLAWQWALDHQLLPFLEAAMAPINYFFDLRVRQGEGSNLFSRSYRQMITAGFAPDHPTVARMIARANFLGMFAATFPSANMETALQQCLTVAQQQGHEAEIAYCQGALGSYYNMVALAPDKALLLLQQALARFRALGDGFFVARAWQWLGLYYMQRGSLPDFHHASVQSISEARRVGNKIDVVYSLVNLTEVTLVRGEYEKAQSSLQEALTYALELDLYVPMAYLDMLRSLLYCLQGELALAQPLIEKAYRLARDYDYGIAVAFTLAVRALLCSLQGNDAAAQQYAQASLAVMGNHGLGVIIANWALAMVACNHQKYQEGHTYIKTALDMAYRGEYTATLVWLLPVAAAVQANMGHQENALELLALSHHHPLRQIGWLAHWPLLVELQQRLPHEVGEPTDQTRSLETIIQQFLQ
ncbi:MAG: protein kinase [Anaerolineae bacterium]|nr:protein kinase [Anaerolineae bacterium]